MKRLFLLRLVSFLIGLCISLSPAISYGETEPVYATKQSAIPIIGRQLFLESLQGSGRMRLDRGGNIYLLNQRDSSILVYDRKFVFVRRIGSLGQGPEDLKNPRDFAVDRFGNLVVADTENNAIKVFSQGGKLVRSFTLDKPYSVDVLSTGEIVAVGGPGHHLIRVLSQEGHLVRYVGEFVSTLAEDKSPALHLYLNRGVLLVDKHDNIFWTGCRLPVPLIRKYSVAGDLLLELQPVSPSIESLMSRARQRVEDQIRTKRIGAIDTLHGIHVDATTGEIWVAPAAPGLLIYDSLGKRKSEVAMKAGPYDPVGAWDVLVLKGGQFIISNGVIGCYLFKLAENSVRKKGGKR